MMEREIKIKASNVQNLSDARYFAAVGAEFIGFDFNPQSPFYVAPSKAKEIMGWLSGPKFYGTFENVTNDEIAAIIKDLNLSAIETYQSNYIQIEGVLNILRVNANEKIEKEASFLCVELEFLNDLKPNKQPFFTAFFGDEVAYKEFVLQHLTVYGIEIKGEIEEKVGLKSFDNMEKLVDLVDEINEGH